MLEDLQVAGNGNIHAHSTMEVYNDQLYDLVWLDTSECSDMECCEGDEDQLDQLDLPCDGDNIYGLMDDTTSYGLLELETCSEGSDLEESERGMDGETSYGSNPAAVDDNTPSSPSGTGDSAITHSSTTLWQAECCCSQRCIAAFSLLELENIRSVFNSKNQKEQRQFMVDQVAATPAVSHTSSNTSQLCLNGKMVCKRAFIHIIGTSHARLTSVVTAWHAGVRKLPSRKRKPRRLSEKHTAMVAWLEAYAHRLGEKMPHLDQVHLPHFLTKKAVYHIMKSKQKHKNTKKVLYTLHASTSIHTQTHIHSERKVTELAMC